MMGARFGFLPVLSLAIGVASIALCPPESARAEPTPAQSPAGALTLQGALARALAASPAIGEARADIAAAFGAERQSRLLPNPEASAQVENFAGSGPYNGLSSAESSIEASQLIELGGKRSARAASARAELSAARTASGATRLDVIHDVTVAYMQALADEEKLRLAQRIETAAEEVLAVVERRVKAARDPLFQESRAKAAVATATAARERAAQELAGSRDVLARFLGEATLTQTLDSEALSDIEAPLSLKVYQDALARSPDITRFQQLLSARQADLNVARAGRIPDVTLNVGARRFSDTDDTAVIAGVSVPLPIFNRNQGEIARAGAEVTRAMKAREQALLLRSQQLSRAWAQWNAAWLEIKRLKTEALPEAERAYELALKGYRAGGFQFIDVQDAQRAYFDVRTSYISALLSLQASRADVERLTASGVSDDSGAPRP